MQASLLDQGLTLMLVGMGTVFIFLTILVAAMSLMALVVKQLTPVAEISGATDEEVAAITAAISQHRKARTSTH